jgi:hypothetical protein
MACSAQAASDQSARSATMTNQLRAWNMMGLFVGQAMPDSVATGTLRTNQYPAQSGFAFSAPEDAC